MCFLKYMKLVCKIKGPKVLVRFRESWENFYRPVFLEQLTFKVFHTTFNHLKLISLLKSDKQTNLNLFFLLHYQHSEMKRF